MTSRILWTRTSGIFTMRKNIAISSLKGRQRRPARAMKNFIDLLKQMKMTIKGQSARTAFLYAFSALQAQKNRTASVGSGRRKTSEARGAKNNDQRRIEGPWAD